MVRLERLLGTLLFLSIGKNYFIRKSKLRKLIYFKNLRTMTFYLGGTIYLTWFLFSSNIFTISVVKLLAGVLKPFPLSFTENVISIRLTICMPSMSRTLWSH